MDDKKILLEVADGPEGILIYTSDSEGVVDWAETFPPVYVVITTDGAFMRLGPYRLPSIYEGLRNALK